jgi:hypothetical protein
MDHIGADRLIDTALILESELFGQPTLRARWKKQYGPR